MAEWDFSIRPAALPLGQNRQKWPTNRPPGKPGGVSATVDFPLAWPADATCLVSDVSTQSQFQFEFVECGT
jgi:hypothetical protein